MTGSASTVPVGAARPWRVRLVVRALACILMLALAGNPAMAGEETRVLEIGYSADLITGADQDDALAVSAVWISHVVERTGIKASTDVRIYTDAASILRNLEARKVDLLMLSPLHYLSMKASPLLRVAFIPSLDGQVGQEYALLVRSDHAGGDIDGLLGRPILVHQSGQGGVARLWLDTYLLRRGLPESGGFFGSFEYVQRASQAVLPVLFGQADVCLVAVHEYETMCDLNPQLRRDLRVLDSSPRFGRGPLCLHREVYDELSLEFDETLLSLHSDPEGQQILALFGVSQVVPFEPRYLESLVDLMDEYERLRAAAGAPASDGP